MKLHRIAGIALLGLFLQTGHAATNTPESVVKTFADHTFVGLPDPNEEPFRSGFSPTLRRLIAEAQVEQDKSIKAYPDQKPPFAEIPMFTGFPDAHSAYRIVEVRQTGKSARVSVDYTVEGTVEKTQMLLALRGTRWVVVDILWGKDGSNGSLTRSLQER